MVTGEPETGRSERETDRDQQRERKRNCVAFWIFSDAGSKPSHYHVVFPWVSGDSHLLGISPPSLPVCKDNFEEGPCSSEDRVCCRLWAGPQHSLVAGLPHYKESGSLMSRCTPAQCLMAYFRTRPSTQAPVGRKEKRASKVEAKPGLPWTTASLANCSQTVIQVTAVGSISHQMLQTSVPVTRTQCLAIMKFR